MTNDIKFFTCDICNTLFVGHRLPFKSDVVCQHCFSKYGEQKKVDSITKVGEILVK